MKRKHSRKKCWLVDDWRKAHTWFSVQGGAAVAFAQPLYEFLPNAQQYVPGSIFHGLTCVLAVMIVVGRLKRQS